MFKLFLKSNSSFGKQSKNRKTFKGVNLNKISLVNYLMIVAKRSVSNEIYEIWLTRFISCSREFNQIYILKVVFARNQDKSKLIQFDIFSPQVTDEL